MVGTVAEDATHFSCRSQRNHAGTELQAFTLLAGFHDAWGAVQAPGEEETPTIPTQLWPPWPHYQPARPGVPTGAVV